MIKKLALALTLFLFSAAVIYARVGVGISIPSRLEMGTVKPNKLYDITEAYVINTGDQFTCYQMGVTYHQDQPEKRIPRDWVIYEPSTFCLEAGAIELIDIDLKVNPKTKIDEGLGGDYFSYVEACTYAGSIGACAGTKLYLSIGN